ncbi:GNAT family N-acetyltransferase [Chitinimonas naiadis]
MVRPPIPRAAYVAEQGGIRIRPFRTGDTAAFFAAVKESIPTLSPWLSWCHAAYSETEAELYVAGRVSAWHAAQGSYSFVIEDTADQTLLGSVGLSAVQDLFLNQANVGYWIRSSATGRGAVTHAVQLVSRFAFEQLGLTRLEIGALVDNVASRRVAEKAGYQYEALLRNGLLSRGEARDSVLYSLIPADLITA